MCIICCAVEDINSVDEVFHILLFLLMIKSFMLSQKPSLSIRLLAATSEIFSISLLLPDPFLLSYIFPRFEEETKNYGEEGS